MEKKIFKKLLVPLMDSNIEATFVEFADEKDFRIFTDVKKHLITLWYMSGSWYFELNDSFMKFWVLDEDFNELERKIRDEVSGIGSQVWFIFRQEAYKWMEEKIYE